jgi:hypothetical protein
MDETAEKDTKRFGFFFRPLLYRKPFSLPAQTAEVTCDGVGYNHLLMTSLQQANGMVSMRSEARDSSSQPVDKE